MRRCVRCRCWKPDAGFLAHDLAYKPGRCDHCRSILKQLKNNTGRGGTSLATRMPTPIERIEATPRDAALKAIAREERALWEARGARLIERPYTFIHDGMTPARSLLDGLKAAV